MKIKYFAWVKDITNTNYDELNKNCPNSIEELKLLLSDKYPELKKHIENNILRYAINMEYTSINQDLKLNDEVAIFPPVSGG